jgi:hypothetical protein
MAASLDLFEPLTPAEVDLVLQLKEAMASTVEVSDAVDPKFVKLVQALGTGGQHGKHNARMLLQNGSRRDAHQRRRKGKTAASSGARASTAFVVILG